ncbi:MAG: hypothetical protein U0939_13905 [Pirellulales bacterium]
MTAVLVLMSSWGVFADDGVALERLPSVHELAELDQQIDAYDALTTDVRWGLHLSTIGATGSQGLGMLDFRATRAGDRLVLPGSSSLRWAVGGGVHSWSGQNDALLPNTLYDLDLDVSLVLWEHERGAVSVGITPGLYGDMQFVDSSTFQVTGWVNGTLDLGERWTLVGGVAVVRQLESRWLPLGGVIWRPAPEWQVDLVFPRPRIARQVAQSDDGDAWLYLAGQFGGGAWSIDDPIVGPAMIRYSDLRLLAGLNLWRASGRELSLELGYVFSREVAIDDLIVSNPTDSWIAQLSWAF